MPKCRSQKDCPKGVLCNEGHCSNFCEKKKDCPSKDSQVAVCKKNLCHYVKTGCHKPSHCPKGKNWIVVGLNETCVKKRVGIKEFSQVQGC